MSETKAPGYFIRLKQVIIDLFIDALRTFGELFKIIIPISIITRFLQQWGLGILGTSMISKVRVKEIWKETCQRLMELAGTANSINEALGIFYYD